MGYKEYKIGDLAQKDFHSESQLNTLANRVKKEGINSPVKAYDFLSSKLGQGCVANKVISLLELR
ncbi:MAG: hypothetical protein PHZ26_02105 [Candidatus Gracilibacteria bacterium]|nr:hypothetical protein [Candidatus Gracilibacteria bacterium]MDD2908528.1 hypothetical protein [Candidatus Gracilibacteria bacterium]